jgi:hypothetical protein
MRLILGCALALIAAAPACAAGGPVSPRQGGAGVSAPGADASFVAVQAGARTVVLRLSRSTASVVRSRSVPGSFGIPGAAWDGANTGLSFDEGTLVLAGGFDSRRTTLQALDARTLHTLRRITLPGMFTVDAISPDGRWLYLIDYKDAGGVDYAVRAYDLRRGRMLARPIVDPRSPDEKMQGVPVTRVQSPDGRWAYTLYAGDEPFVHALDTVKRTAVCVDLPMSLANDVGEGRLSLRGGTLQVTVQGQAQAVVDLRTFKVGRPAAAAAPRPRATARPQPAPAGDGGPPWALWAIPLAGVVALAVFARRRMSTSGAWSRN